MATKQCTRCGVEKDIGCFLYASGKPTGSRCKACILDCQRLRRGNAVRAKADINASNYKRCTKCGEHKPKSRFTADRQKKDGLRPDCLDCAPRYGESQYLASRKWQLRNRDAVRALKRRAYYRQHTKRRPPKDPTAPGRAKKAWKQRNPERVIDDHNRRRAREAVPAWANRFLIQEIYALCKLRNRTTGIRWHVDHVIPLRSPVVCGLHVENNLRVIPAVENYRKGNRMEMHA